MDPECCKTLHKLVSMFDDGAEAFERKDWSKLVEFTLNSRQCSCQPSDAVFQEKIGNVTNLFIQFCIKQMHNVSNGCFRQESRSNPFNEIDLFFQGLTKLFQVHFYLTDTGKKLQGLMSVKHDSVWTYCDISNEEAPAQMLENVAFFCESGGLDAIKDCFDSEKSEMPISLASCFISIIAQLRVWLSRDAIKKVIKPLAAPVLRYLCNLSEEEIRMPNTRAMADLMLSTIKVECDGGSRLDRNSLELSLTYFMSSTLTVRMEGLNQITNQIHNLIELSQNDSFGDIDSLCQDLARWLIEKEMIEHLFGPNHHIELLKQSQFLLNFLAQERHLKPKHLECVWNAAQLKHTGKFVLDLLISLTKHMDLKSIQYLLSLVGNLAVGSHTKQTLLLASLLTRRVWSSTLATGVRVKQNKVKETSVPGKQSKKRVDVSPVESESASLSSDGSTDEEVAIIHTSNLVEDECQTRQARRKKRPDFTPISSLDLRMKDTEMHPLSNEEPLEVSPRDFEDSDDLLPASSFQNDHADGDFDEDEINYMNVSPVSEREHESEESEEEVVSLTSCVPASQQTKSPQTNRGELDADSLCREGRTLLWDLLQEENIEELGDGMVQEVQKLLWQLVCYTGNKSVVMAFIKGCLDNIAMNSSVVISLQILPKIINGYPSKNSSESHWLLEWAVKKLSMMDIFFSNLRDFVDTWQALSADDDTGRTHHREQQILARLDLLTALYSNELSPDHFRLTIDQVDCLWSCLITRIPDRFHYLLLSWLLKQTNNKELHALGLDNYKHIFMNKLPEVNPVTITFTGLGLFQQLFSLTRLSNASPFAEDSQNEEIPGIDYLWKIVLNAQRDQVADEAMAYLNFLYIQIGNGSMEKEKEFLDKCMMYLLKSMDDISEKREEALRVIQQILTILKSHLDAYWKRFAYHIHLWQLTGHDFEGHQPNVRSHGKEQVIRIICQPAGISEKVSFRLSSHDLLAKLRAEVTHWCVQLQREQEETGQPQGTPPLQPPFRLISHGHELTPDLDQKAIGELGMKDQQLVFVSVSHPRKDRSQSQVPASLQPSPEMDASPMVQLLREENFSLFFRLLDVLHKAISITEEMPMQIVATISARDRSQRLNVGARKLSSNDLVHSLWELLMILPTNREIKQKFESFDAERCGSSEAQCSQFINTDSMFKLLYVLHIIDALSTNDQDVLQSNSQDDTSTDSESSSSENEQTVSRSTEPLGWVKKFIKYGGLKHLYDRLLCDSLSVKRSSDDWTLDCVGYLLKLLTRFGCVSLSKEEKEDSGEREEKRRAPEGKQKRHVFRARYKSIEGDNVVVIQGFNQSLLDLIKEDILLEKLIALLCDVSENTNQYAAGSQDVHAAVVYHCLSFLVCWTYMDNRVKVSLVHHATFELLLKRLVFESPQKSVRSEASRGIYKMCVSGKFSMLNDVLKLLLQNLPHLVASHPILLQKYQSSKSATSSYKDYFWLLSRLIDKLEVSPELTGRVNIEEATIMVSKFIADHSSTKEPTPTSDYCLIGLLQTCASLLRHEPQFKFSTDGRTLLAKVFSDCLFRMPLSPCDGQTARPTCETKTARGAAFDLLLKVAHGSEDNYKELQKLFLKHHSMDAKTGTHTTYGWNYWPHELERSSAGYVGLVNLGATCYMASCVQQLFMIPKARAALLEATPSNQMKFPMILKELQRMFTYLQESYRKAYNPRSFCKTYTMDKQPLNTGEQKDMAEFFTDLISKLEEMDDNLKHTMRELFCGVITNNVVSLDCEHVSKREEEFYSVRCTVADMKNLYESLDEETVKDVLEGDNKYTCSQCQEKVRAEKRACFKTFPKILCFNTMRYTFNMVTMMKEKVNTHFSFPMRLNMAPYAEEYLMQNKEQDPDDDPRYWYNLAGVVVHTGTADGGHYYSFIRDRYSKSGSWYLFNDAEVKPFDPSQIGAECFGGEMMTKTYDAVTEKYMDVSFEKTHSAYMLFYEHVSMTEEVHPIEKVALGQDLQDWIWEDNAQFLRDKLVFDISYFNFIWQFCNTIPKSISTSVPVTYFSIKLATSFLLETFVHSREKPHMKSWMELLLSGLERCHPACEWFLDAMGGDDWWLQQMFIKCPAQPLRQMFGQLCLHAIKIIRPMQVNKYCHVSDSESDSNGANDGEVGSCSPITRFIKTALTLLEDNVRSHCKNLGELFNFIFQFVTIGQEERTFMLSIDAISAIVHFYMGLKASEVADMANDDDEDLDIDEEDILSIFPEERYNPSALEKMISTIAVLLDESRDEGRLQMSENDYQSLTGKKDFPFIYQITKDAINLKQTAHIIFSLCQYNQGMAERILLMMINAIEKLPSEQLQHFFKLLSLLTEHDSVANLGLPSFTNLILPRMAQLAEHNPGLYIEWLTSQVPRNKTAHQWTLKNLDQWVERYLIADDNPRIRIGAAFLLVSLVPNPHFPQAFRARSFAQPQKEWKMSAETKVVLHKIYTYLLNLLKTSRKYADAGQQGTTKLVSFFSVLNYMLVSEDEKQMFAPYSMDLWKLFYPGMTEPDIAVHFNKQALLTFWFHVCIGCEDNIKFITETPEVFNNIAYNYILSNDEPEVISFNRNALPVYYGLLRLACHFSREFCQQLAHHRNMNWAFKHLTPRINQYPQAVEELFNLLGLFTSHRQSEENPEQIEAFRAKAISLFSTSIDGQSAWTTLISAYKILLQSEDDLLLVVTSKGLHTLSEAFFTLFIMYYEATACNVEDDIAEVFQILFTVLNCCVKFRDRQEIKRGLFAWKERREVMQKLASMINSYSPKKIRHYCTDLLTILLVLYNEDTIDTMGPVIYQSHITIGNHRNPPIPAQYFPRRSNKPLPRKFSIAQRIPELNMVLHPVYIEAQKGIDDLYDQSLAEFFYDYHQFVDKLCRYALNSDQVPLVIIEISCILGVEAIPLRFHLFPKLWVEVKNKSHENPRFRNCIEKLMQCDPFMEYIDTILAEERDSLSNAAVFSFMLQFLPKVHSRILGGQKQGLVDTIVSKMIADCTVLNNENDKDLERTAHQTTGDLRALTLLFAVSSPNELTVGTLLNGSLRTLLERCQLYKERQLNKTDDAKHGRLNLNSSNEKDGSAMLKTADSIEAVASCSSNSPAHSTGPTTPSGYGVGDTKEGLKVIEESEPLEPPTKKTKVSQPDPKCNAKNHMEGESEKMATVDAHEETSFEVRSLPTTDTVNEENKEVAKMTENEESEDSSDSGSTTSSSSSENEKASARRDSSKQQSEFYKSTKALQPTMVDMLRRSSSELLRCLQRFLEGPFCRKSPISTGRNGRLRPGKLLNLIEHIGNKTRQFQYYCFDIDGAVAFQAGILFLTHQDIFVENVRSGSLKFHIAEERLNL